MAKTVQRALTPALPEGAAAVTRLSPRDGLHESPAWAASGGKAALTAGYAAAGVTGIEAASFMRPYPVPRLASAVTP